LQKSKKTVDNITKRCYNENKDTVAALATQEKGEKNAHKQIIGTHARKWTYSK
jgi:hypothetical protein